MSRSKVVVSWAFVVLWACFIFFMSANTGSWLHSGAGLVSAVFCGLRDAQAALLGPDTDVVSPCAHFCEYAVFGALLANALRHHLLVRKAPAAALVCGSLYGVTDEFHQLFVAGRSGQPFDVGVDTAGAFVAVAIAVVVVRMRERCRV